jgi:adhesin transport system membrane fusion protein
MSPLDELRASNPIPSWRAAAWIVVLLTGSALAWAHQARLDEVATATGEVVPQGQIKVIQHLEGGIIERLDVVEGRKVSAGDTLLQLNLGASGINRDELQVQIDGLQARRTRLTAEMHGRPLKFPPELEKRAREVVEAEREAFVSRQRQNDSTIEILERQVRQREQEINELLAKRSAITAGLKLGRERLAVSSDLLRDKLTSQIEHLAVAAEVERLQGQLAETQASIPKVRESLAEAQERVRETRLKFNRAAVEELGQVELAIARARELMTRASEQVSRTEIKSPIDGVVTKLRFHTIGGVVGPRDPIMEIVPSSDKLVVEAKLDPVDVGYVQASQPVVVKVTTYDFVRYGGLDGHVVRVAPDSTTDAQGRTYFRVVAETNKAHLGDDPGTFPITPGMQTTVDIHTGERSVLDYLITPVLKLKHEAFRER